MITNAPLPGWRELLHSLLSIKKCDSKRIAAYWTQSSNDVGGVFSRSAWALAQIVIWRKRLVESDKIVVWVPDYFCNASLAPLRTLGVELFFYPINEKLQPDYRFCRKHADKQRPDLFLLAHYFGQPAPAAPARDFCRNQGAWLIEDAAHMLYPLPGVGKYADFVLYSPHKLLAIPAGSVLVARSKGPGALGDTGLEVLGNPDDWAESLADMDFVASLSHDSTWVRERLWLIKRVLQKIGFRKSHSDASFVHEDQTDNARLASPRLSSFSCRMLAHLIHSVPEAASWRQRNQLLWDELTEELFPELVPMQRPIDYNWVPYMASYAVEPDDAQEVFSRLRSRNIPVMSWPDLPPEINHDIDLHHEAWSLRHGRVYFPLHQSIRPHALLKTLPGMDHPVQQESICLEWDRLKSAFDWNELMIQVDQSNLLQSWAYGEAKSEIEGWRVQRGVFVNAEGVPVAIVQMLEKRYFGILKVIRINRGPLFIGKNDDSLRQHVMQMLTHAVSGVTRGKLLVFAPELRISGKNLLFLSKIGFRQLRPKGWKSIWVDLTRDEQALLKGLNGKWRNMLVVAEKNEMNVTVSSDTLEFEWLLEHCDAMMKERDVSVPVALYRKLHQKMMKSEQPMLVFRAHSGDDAVAGICVVRHGNDATYLLGWNGDQGRRLNANHLLLWYAMLHLKKQGVTGFDFGGLDEENAPGISKFKKGIGGEKYANVGNGAVV